MTSERIDRLGKFGAALLVDATGVDPNPLKTSAAGEITALFNLDVALMISLFALSELLKGYLLIAPPVRQNSVGWDLAIKELLELECFRVEKTHAGRIGGFVRSKAVNDDVGAEIARPVAVP
ncbi:MAG: hypothetical protein ASARMPRED_008801 [Alectoria sarmentosa]|nr:MAG: hypothetical protein ASARMPRED_008801 [Alectoria sarmentosa]